MTTAPRAKKRRFGDPSVAWSWHHRGKPRVSSEAVLEQATDGVADRRGRRVAGSPAERGELPRVVGEAGHVARPAAVVAAEDDRGLGPTPRLGHDPGDPPARG